MRAVIQRVNSGSVTVDNQVVGDINKGLVIFLGVGKDDTKEDAHYLAEKAANLRIFPDEDGKMNLSILDIGGEILAVSQFTLFGDCRKGRRPNFMDAALPQVANDLYQMFISKFQEMGVKVATGVFQTHMKVSIENDGPVTILVDSKKEY